MSFTEYKSFLIDYLERITETSPKAGRNMYICPFCGSGTGKDKTGALGVFDNGQKWKCQACHRGGDTVDLIAQYESISTAEAKQKAAELFGNQQTTTLKPTNNRTRTDKQPASKPLYTPEQIKSFSEQIQQQGNKGLEYLQRRGFSPAIIKAHLIGFDGQNIVIPYIGTNSYFLRGALNGSTYKGKRGQSGLYNEIALHGSAPVFIVEGELDALAIIQAGGQACALGSTANANKLLEAVKKEKPRAAELVICLDNDEAGQTATQTIINGLQGLKIAHRTANIAGQYKDPAERLQSEINGLQVAIKEVLKTMNNNQQTTTQSKYKKGSAAERFIKFETDIKSGIDNTISTGFRGLDSALGGGLYSGLFVLGAMPGIGKSAFTLQLADYIAQNGREVIIYSLEMTEREIIARSLSRLSYLDGAAPMTAQQIQKGGAYAMQIKEKYLSYANNVFINEAENGITAADIETELKERTEETGNAPVVILDYLQLIAPANQYETDKGRLDNAVIILKRLSAKYKTPVLVISSLNRAGYNSAVTMEALKETGGIEYTANAALGFQFTSIEENGFNMRQELDKQPREMSVTVLKNRAGQNGQRIDFKYYSAYNYFYEIEGGTDQTKRQRPQNKII